MAWFTKHCKKYSIFLNGATMLQALAYNLLSPTAALTGHALGLCWCSNSSTLVTDHSYQTFFWPPMLLMRSQIKPKLFESRHNSFSYLVWTCLMFMCKPWRYVAFTVLSSPTVLVEIKECPFSGVTSSGTVGRKVSESEIWSVWCYLHTKCKKHERLANFNVPVKNMQTNWNSTA